MLPFSIIHSSFLEGSRWKRRLISAGMTVCPLAVIVLRMIASLNYLSIGFVIQYSENTLRRQFNNDVFFIPADSNEDNGEGFSSCALLSEIRNSQSELSPYSPS